ncbi:MAG: hypothetical protein WBB00_02005 [Mycobacterium sp.]
MNISVALPRSAEPLLHIDDVRIVSFLRGTADDILNGGRGLSVRNNRCLGLRFPSARN